MRDSIVIVKKSIVLLLVLFLNCLAFLSQSINKFQNENGYFGFADESGKTVIEAKYTHAENFSEGLALVSLTKNDSDKYGFINANAETIIPFQFDEARSFSSGLAAVRKKDKWGYVDTKGKIVFPFEFDVAESFSRGGAWVAKPTEKYFSRKGKLYDEAIGFYKAASIVRIGKKYGIIDTSGNEVIAPAFTDIQAITQHSFRLNMDGREAVLDSSFQLQNAIYPEQVKKKFGFVDLYGKTVVKPKYDSADSHDEYFFIVSIKKKFGLVDLKGKEIVPCKYDYIDFFLDGKASVLLNGKEFFINREGKELR